MSDIFKEKGPFYYPFSKPLLGSIDDLCSNPSNFGCVLNTNYSTTNCGSGSKPVLDCGIGTGAVCCPETIFPYVKTTEYCTYLNNQGCFGHQVYNWPHGQGSSINCPVGTYDVSDCGLCCPTDITSNLNFTDISYDPLKNNTIGDLWNKDDSNLENGLYKVTVGENCVMNFNGGNVPVMYKNSINSYATNQYPGDCGGTWEITKMAEQYIGEGIYPSLDTKYIPGGYTLYNSVSGLYLSMKNSVYGHGVNISLSPDPAIVLIFKNIDGSYRIQNARNQIGSFQGVGNIGNPLNCAIIDSSGNFGVYNWGNGLSGLPCGIGNGSDQSNYKFQFTKIDSASATASTSAVISNGDYYIEVQDTANFIKDTYTNKCIVSDGSISNYGGDSTCGTLVPRFNMNKNYIWTLVNESGGGFSLQNKTNGNFIQPPVYGENISTGTNKSILNIFNNSDNSVRITSTDIVPICLIYQNGSLQGFNWNVNSFECGTGPNTTIFDYKFNFVPVPSIVIPPVSDLPKGEGTYEINTGTSEGLLFEQISGGGTKQIQQGCTISCPIINNNIPNILEMSSKFTPDNLSEQQWIISKEIDNNGNNGYTIQNVASNRYMTLLGDSNQILETTDAKTVLFMYTNLDGTYTIQNQQGACLYRSSQKYADTLDGSGLWNYNYTANLFNQSSNACGLTSPSKEVSYTLNYINPPAVAQKLSGYGGNCNYTLYNPDLSTTIVSGFSDEVSCNAAIAFSQQNSTNSSSGTWKPFFNGESHILYTYGGKCLSIDNNDNVIASTTCTKTNPKGTTIVNQPWYWVFTPEKDSNGMHTGNYFIMNQLTGKYIYVPTAPSTSNLTTVTTPTSVGIKLTYPTFGSQVSANKLSPTSYYFHFINPSVDQVCAYSNNSGTQAISWGTNTGFVSSSPIAPIEQQQRQILYECGISPTTDSNYQFTVDGYCLSDFQNQYNEPLCFNDDGSGI